MYIHNYGLECTWQPYLICIATNPHRQVSSHTHCNPHATGGVVDTCNWYNPHSTGGVVDTWYNPHTTGVVDTWYNPHTIGGVVDPGITPHYRRTPHHSRSGCRDMHVRYICNQSTPQMSWQAALTHEQICNRSTSPNPTASHRKHFYIGLRGTM